MFSIENDTKIALIAAILGIALLLFLETSFQPKELSIGKISFENIDETVSVNAKIDWAKKTANALMFGLNDGNKLNAVMFFPNQNELELLKKGSFVKVIGKVKVYNGKLELIVEKVDSID